MGSRHRIHHDLHANPDHRDGSHDDDLGGPHHHPGGDDPGPGHDIGRIIPDVEGPSDRRLDWMTHRLEVFDARTAPEEVLRGVHDVITAIEAEELPAGPPVPYEQRLMRLMAAPPAHLEVTSRVALEGGSVVGYSRCQTWPEEDPDNAFAQIMVAPEHRRHGVGRALLSELVGELVAGGRGKMIIDCVDGWPVESALARLGLRKSLTEKRSRLRISDLDLRLMERWIARAGERASDYEVVFFDDTVAEEDLDSWARAKTAIQDEPMEDLEFDFAPITPARWRDHERYVAEKGETLRACGARHIPTGEFAGTTTLYVQEHMRELAIQGDTAVVASHRNRGLGRLVKAAMIRRLLAEFPEVRMVDTHNAGSNDAMLGINIEMGFEPILVISAWQGQTETVRANLGK
jgi:GNAT superfamily N-acetyltransferase